jgi:hypothetical protein
MRRAFAHDAVLAMGPDGDTRAPGGAVTTALCGHWEHAPPCPLAAHHTRADRDGGELRVRILFGTEPDREADVRGLIDAALASGSFRGPDDTTTTWALVTSGPGEISPDEAAHAARLTA